MRIKVEIIEGKDSIRVWTEGHCLGVFKKDIYGKKDATRVASVACDLLDYWGKSYGFKTQFVSNLNGYKKTISTIKNDLKSGHDSYFYMGLSFGALIMVLIEAAVRMVSL